MERNGITWARHRGAFDINECGDCPTCLLPGTGRHRGIWRSSHL